jgi:AcrR family transcriptional regulator
VASTRDAILDSTVELLAARGLDGTSMERVRKSAGVSNGSLFHHFSTKEALVAALYLRTLSEYHAVIAHALGKRTSAERTTTAIVRAHLEWVLEHPAKARLLHEMRWSEAVGSAKEELGALNREIFTKLKAWAAPQVEAGVVRDLPMDMLVAIVLGPSMELTRAWLREPNPARARRFIPILADAAWCAIRAKGPEGP